MAPKLTDADIKILISSITNSQVKLAPDFEQVAKENGLKDSRAAYHKHWSLMRKLGLTGSRPSSTPKKNPRTREAPQVAGSKRAASAVTQNEGNAGNESGEVHVNGDSGGVEGERIECGAGNGCAKRAKKDA